MSSSAGHDAVIQRHAGLPLPSASQRAEIAAIDIRCLAVEHREFHRTSSRPWHHESLGLKPDRSVRRFQAPDKIADQLYARFERYSLPCAAMRRPVCSRGLSRVAVPHHSARGASARPGDRHPRRRDEIDDPDPQSRSPRRRRGYAHDHRHNLDQETSVRVPVDIGAPGAITLEARLLHDVVRKQPPTR